MDEARSLLRDSKLSVRVDFEVNDEFSVNTVFDQKPAVGTTVEQADTVLLWISIGPAAVSLLPVPPVVSLTQESATGALQDVGFEVNVRFQALPVDSPNAGRVISQSPLPDEEVAAGAAVTIVVGEAEALPIPVIDEEAVLTFAYEWGPSEEAAALQTLLGLTADGWYGPGTQAAHVAELEARGLSTDNVPNLPPATTTATTTTTTMTTVAPETTVAAETTTTAPTTTVAPSVFEGMGAEVVAHLLGQPCIADGDLSDCPPSVVDLISGWTG
jgi:hypothetical protein